MIIKINNATKRTAAVRVALCESLEGYRDFLQKAIEDKLNKRQTMKKIVVRFMTDSYNETEIFAIEITNEKFSTFICCIAIGFDKIEISQSILTDVIYIDTYEKKHFKKMVEWIEKFGG